MYNLYTYDDDRMKDFNVKRSVIILDNNKKKVLEYIYMLDSSGKEYVKHSTIYNNSQMLNIIKTSTYSEYLKDFEKILVDTFYLIEDTMNISVIEDKEVFKEVAREIKSIKKMYKQVIAKVDEVDLLTILIDYKM